MTTSRRAPGTAGRVPELWTIREAAEWLHKSVPATYALHREGKLPGVRRLGRTLYVVRDELIAAVMEGK